MIANGFTLLRNDKGAYYSCLGSMEQIHPMVAIRMSDKKNFGNSLMGTLYANLTPFKGFVFTTRLGYRELNANTYQYNNLYYGSLPPIIRIRTGPAAPTPLLPIISGRTL